MIIKTAWTPGPYLFKGDEIYQESTGRTIARVMDRDNTADGELLALAPEMAEALRLVRDDLARYAAKCGPGPDARLAAVDSILSRLPAVK